MSTTIDAHRSQPQVDDTARWAQLCEELITSFPALTGKDVIQVVANARGATDLFGLQPDEQLTAAASIARNNLDLLVSGNDLARLDPETHSSRKGAE
jgi:hypothetical protein